MMQKIPQLERFPVLQDEFRAGSSDSPRISTRAGPGRAEPEQTLTNLWTAWHCSAEARSGRAGTTAGGRGRHAFSQGETGTNWIMGKRAAPHQSENKVLQLLFLSNHDPKNMDTVCQNYIKIPDVVSSYLCSPHGDAPMEAAGLGDSNANRRANPKLTSTTPLVCSLTTAESLMTNWVIVQSIISFLHPSRSERATAGVNSLIGETRSLQRTIRENSGINWVWLRELFNGKQLFFAWHNWRSDGASGGACWRQSFVGVSVWQTDRSRW